MYRYLVRRLARGLLTLALMSFVIFAATNLLPGDPARAILGKDATPDALARARSGLGLDRPFWVRYLDWVQGVIRLDFGRSLTQGVKVYNDGAFDSGMPVSQVIAAALANSALLAGVSLAIVVLISTIVGSWAAMHQDSLADQSIQFAMLALLALPEFLLGTGLVSLLALKWALLPAVSFDVTPRSLILPSATLVLSAVGVTTRMVRVTVSDVLDANHVVMARLRGISEWRVLMRHVLPVVIAPTAQIIAILAAAFTGGVVVVEYIFAYPGIGQGLVNAVAGRDYPVVQAFALIIVAVYLGANVIADWLTLASNPHILAGLE